MNREERQGGGSIQTAEEERVKARGIKEVETGRADSKQTRMSASISGWESAKLVKESHP